MGARLIPILLLSFLGGVGFRSFFDVSLKFSWMILGILSGIEASRYLFLKSFRRHEKLGLPAIELRDSAAGSFRAENADSQQSQELLDYRFEKINIAMLIVLLFFLGTIHFSYFEKNIEKDNLHNFYDQKVSLEGTVLESKLTQASQRMVLKTSEGKTLLVTKVFPNYSYGDLLKVFGELKEPENFGSINMKKILARDKIYSQMVFPQIQKIGSSPTSKIMNFLFFVREKFEEKIKLVLPEPHSSLANGMLLGNEGVLEANILDAFKKSGTIHVLVLSGYNITIIGNAIANLFGFVPAVLSIILFVLMTGAEAPAVRAAIMGIIGLLIFYTGRPKTATLVLLWSAVLMVLWNPAILRFDHGFQLSFLATLGLCLASGFFAKKFKFLPSFLSIRENAASTFSAQLFVLPLLISWGNHISYLSPIANILIVGAVPYVMGFSFLGALGAFLFQSLGQSIASVSYVLITYQIYVAKIFANF